MCHKWNKTSKLSIVHVLTHLFVLSELFIIVCVTCVFVLLLVLYPDRPFTKNMFAQEKHSWNSPSRKVAHIKIILPLGTHYIYILTVRTKYNIQM
jgi:hypothetical protein